MLLVFSSNNSVFEIKINNVLRIIHKFTNLYGSGSGDLRNNTKLASACQKLNLYEMHIIFCENV